MITNVLGVKENEKFIELQINFAINLIIYKKEKKGKLDIEYHFDRTLITQNEAQEIVDYFITTEGEEIFKSKRNSN